MAATVSVTSVKSPELFNGWPSPTSTPAADALADLEAVGRVAAALDRLAELEQQLAVEEGYDVPPLEYTLPEGFFASVVIPVYNEESTIRTILSRVRALPLPLEVVVVDDYSTDRTRAILRELEQAAGLTVIYKPRNEGKGAALRTGFDYARGNVVIVQDADLEYDPRDILQVVRPVIEGDADVAYGSRFLNAAQDPSLVHRLGNRMLTWASNVTTGLRITDMETCYKAFRRDVLRTVHIRQDRFGFEPEITAKLARRGMRFAEVPISYHARGWEEGKKIGLKDAFNAFYCIARYAWAD